MRRAPMGLENPLSIYVHVPFCLKKCGYCDFHSIAMRPEDVPQKEYAIAVCEELRQLGDRYGLSEKRVGTIYFGGGTPTMFEPASLNIILEAIRGNFSVEAGAEVSIEANPETIVRSPALKRIGSDFTRLSIGIQSFNDDHLRALGRVHNADTAVRAVRTAQDAGFKNIGIDLMWGLPGQTLAELEKDLDAALGLSVQHMSAYQLTVGEREERRLPSEDMTHEMFLLVHDKLTSAGYEHYEISNFAKIGPGSGPGFCCRHNLNYWRYGEWMGVGCSATSQISDLKFRIPVRFTVDKNISDYLEHKFQYEVEEITLNEAIAEYSFMNLRTSDGFDLNDFKRRFGREFDDVYPGLRQKWLTTGWAEMGSDPISPLRLTLSGWLISDELFHSFV